MISIRDISLAFGGQELFEGASLQLNRGDRYALVGPNGAGKSTLFRMILGEIAPDEGEVEIKRGTVLGWLPQENPPVGDRTVLREALHGLDEDDGRLEAKAKSILAGLGFRTRDFDRPVRELSGGWAMRVAMARLLVEEPDLLMLDEPTNHLDLWTLLWFREHLRRYDGTIFVISHDRAFINAVCTAMVSVQDRGLKVYRGSYEDFVVARAGEKERLQDAKERQDAEITRMQDFISRNRARLSTAKRAQSMMKRLDRLERIEIPPDPKILAVRLPQPPRSGKETLTLKGIHKSYGDTVVYRGLDLALQRGWKCALVGPNGAGKSTLLKIMAGVLPFERGERVLGHNVVAGYLAQHREGTMDPERTVLDEAMAGGQRHPEPFVRGILGSFLFGGDAARKKTRVLSGGEKSRLGIVKMLLDPPNVLFLDEPTTHLDMASVDALVEALKRYEGTLAFISHDLHFINALANQVIHVDAGNVTVYPGTFDLFMWQKDRKGVD
jgi:ATP-binding cassette subfamily F protein 3